MFNGGEEEENDVVRMAKINVNRWMTRKNKRRGKARAN
jgi:hypothetical protein